MQFVFLYGRPAVGKLTVAQELGTLTTYPVFHNHLIVDAVLAVHPFGSAGFVALRDALWRTAFHEIAKTTDLPGLIFTFNPENSVPQAVVDDLFQLFENAGHDIRVFELACPEVEVERRLDSPSRHDHRKLTDLKLYLRLRAEGAFDSPRISRNRVVIDTSEMPPAAAARAIADRLV